MCMAMYLARNEIKARLRAQGQKPQMIEASEITRMARELLNEEWFDERGWETERCRMAQATAPILDSTSHHALPFGGEAAANAHNAWTIRSRSASVGVNR
jgi:hypothetical protein